MNNEINETKDNFPYFLYEKYPKVLEVAKRFNFTAEMIEIYCYYYYMREQGKNITDYTFFDKHGGFIRTWSIIDEMKGLLGANNLCNELNDPDQWLFYYGIRNPGKPFVFGDESPGNVYIRIKMLFKAKEDPVNYIISDSCKHWKIDFSMRLFLLTSDFPIDITDFEERIAETHIDRREIRFIKLVVELSQSKTKYQLRDFIEVKECFYLEERDDDKVYLCLTPIGEKFIEWLKEE